MRGRLFVVAFVGVALAVCGSSSKASTSPSATSLPSSVTHASDVVAALTAADLGCTDSATPKGPGGSTIPPGTEFVSCSIAGENGIITVYKNTAGLHAAVDKYHDSLCYVTARVSVVLALTHLAATGSCKQCAPRPLVALPTL